MQEGDLEESLIDVIGNKGGKDLLIEAAEFSLDAILNDGLTKEIPIVGVISKLYDAAIGCQGYIFAKKIRMFLTALETVPKSDRDDFIEKLNNDNKLKEKTADTLVSFINKIDDLQKAPLLARAFSGYIKEEYDFTTFQRLAVAIDRCIVTDLKLLEKLNKPTELDGYVGDMLVGSGLASVSGIPLISAPHAKTTYIISHLGELFVNVVIKSESPDE